MDGAQHSFTSFEETEVVESAHLAQDSTQQVVHNLEEEARSVAEVGFKHMLPFLWKLNHGTGTQSYIVFAILSNCTEIKPKRPKRPKSKFAKTTLLVTC